MQEINHCSELSKEVVDFETLNIFHIQSAFLKNML